MTATGNAGEAGGGTDHAVVIGAGATGLSAALELSLQGAAVTVVERERWSLGGRRRTLDFMGCRFDIGPQPLFSQFPEVEAFWSGLLGDEVSESVASARVLHRGTYLQAPVGTWEALQSQGAIEAVRCLPSLAQARLNPIEQPATLDELGWNQLGDRLFSRFYAGYINKVYGLSAAELSLDSYGLGPIAPAAGNAFRYPRRGSGQLWESVAARLQRSGHRVRMGEQVVAVRHGDGRVIALTVRDPAGRTVDLVGSHFLSTMPIFELIARLSPLPPTLVRRAAQALSYRDLLTVNVVLDRAETFPYHWIDVLDPSVSVARISNFKNFSEAMVADPGLTGLGMQYLCRQEDALWSAADAELLDLGRRELVRLGICQPDDVKTGVVHRQRHAFAVRTGSTDDSLGVIYDWLEGALPNLVVAGDDGTAGDWPQGDSIAEGMLLARNIAARRAGGQARARAAGREALDILVGLRSGVAQR
jgi:protoporphyrinogen oxidase